MNTQEKIELVTEAQECMFQAIELLQSAELGNSTQKSIIDHLRIMTSNDHDFLSRDKNLNDVIAELHEEANDCEE